MVNPTVHVHVDEDLASTTNPMHAQSQCLIGHTYPKGRDTNMPYLHVIALKTRHCAD